jgi:hypothetical protein
VNWSDETVPARFKIWGLVVLKCPQQKWKQLTKTCQRVLDSLGAQRFHASTFYLLIESYSPWSKAT